MRFRQGGFVTLDDDYQDEARFYLATDRCITNGS